MLSLNTCLIFFVIKDDVAAIQSLIWLCKIVKRGIATYGINSALKVTVIDCPAS